MLAFVLPPEKASLPDVGKTLTVVYRGNMFFKHEGIARVIRRGWMRLPEHFTEVYEVSL